MAEHERRLEAGELSSLATILAQRFIQRWDCYPVQIPDGRYVTIHEPLHEGLLVAHLRGELTLGAYALDKESTGRFLVFDADSREQWQRLITLCEQLSTEAATSYLERSQRGGHLWLFFDDPLSGSQIRGFGQGLQTAYGLQDIEMYPKQDELRGGPGSLIRLPFGVHRKTGRRYGFVTPTGEALAPMISQQIRLLESPETVPAAVVTAYETVSNNKAKEPVLTPAEPLGDRVSQRIKGAISVYEFVGQYVELTESGRGLCPFHDDQTPSFGVNIEDNYWHCFAGCGGGSIIDFWMKYRKCDFQQAVSELAKMLL